MLIYGAGLSPYARKVCLAAREKGVAYELFVTSPHGTDPGFVEASPFGKLPAIRDGDFLLSDSSAILAYLEAKHPTPALYPADAQARGKAVWFDEFADTLLGASALKVQWHRLVAPKLLKLPFDEEIAKQGEAELPPMLDYLERVAPDDGWLAGPDFSIADIAVACMLRTLDKFGLAFDAEARPRTVAWFARVAQRPAWQEIVAIENAPRKK